MAKYLFSTEEIDQLLEDYNSSINRLNANGIERAYIWDETLRDGEQTPGVFLTTQEKIDIAKLMDEVGISMAAVGFPAVSEGERRSVSAIIKEGYSNLSIMAISRPRTKDIDACLACNCKEIVMFMPISDLMMEIFNHNPETVLKSISESMDYARDHGLVVNWVSEDASRARFDHMINVFSTALDHGAKRIVVSDTVGVLFPETTGVLVEKIRAALNRDGLQLGFHGHNDFGLAVANTIQSVLHGAIYPHVCINGYGERAGNAAFEEVVINLERLGIKTGIKLDKITEISELTEKYFGLPLSAHKPIVGYNAFSHESGLHINAVLAHPKSYEPLNPKSVGRTRKFYIGKFSGSGAIANAIKTKLNLLHLDIPDKMIKEFVKRIKTTYENSNKAKQREMFQTVKRLLSEITSGLPDTQFFQILRDVVGEYGDEEWKKLLESKMKERNHKAEAEKNRDNGGP